MDWKQLLAAILPSILQMLETLYAKKTGQVSNGPVKQGAAVIIAQSVLMTAAASPDIVTIEQATDVVAIRDFVDQLVRTMKAQGKLGGSKIKLVSPSLEDIDKAIDKATSKPPVSKLQVQVGAFQPAPPPQPATPRYKLPEQFREQK